MPLITRAKSYEGLLMSDDYEFETRSADEIVLAIFDKLGIKLTKLHINYIGY
jgi:hypothetical protein